ncbi:MAG: TIGR02647 family protein [Gammaproteobacteria bacterium]|nr:TIGR02647 family protein [Gammaproteobacteria bacterium]
MHLDSELIEELNLLSRYRMNPSAAGIEIGQAAEAGIIAAAQRLHEKGIITRPDGGALTDSGREALEHMIRLFNQLSPPLEPI